MSALTVVPLIPLLALSGARTRLPRPDPTPPAAVANCASAAQVWLAVLRPGLPPASLPTGDCASPDLVPIRVEALVVDADGLGVAGCDVSFAFDFGQLATCGVAFGQFCGGPSVVATTGAGGLAATEYTLTQAELDSCNCLPSACACLDPPAPFDCDPTAPGFQPGYGWCPAGAVLLAHPHLPHPAFSGGPVLPGGHPRHRRGPALAGAVRRVRALRAAGSASVRG